MTTLPADLAGFPDLLDRGAPILYRLNDGEEGDDLPGTAIGHGLYAVETPEADWMLAYGDEIRDVRLDLSHPLARAHLAHVLAGGLRCPVCASEPGYNGACATDGWARKPAPIWWALPKSEGGQLPDELAHFAPALLAGHVRLVGAGKAGIVGVNGAWFEEAGMWWRAPIGGKAHNIHMDADGWTVVAAGAYGPETGDAGQRLADLAALSAGFALASGPDLVMPEGA